MKDYRIRLTTAMVLVAIAGLMAGCANTGVDGRESSITTYGTLDVGISHTTNK